MNEPLSCYRNLVVLLLQFGSHTCSLNYLYWTRQGELIYQTSLRDEIKSNDCFCV